MTWFRAMAGIRAMVCVGEMARIMAKAMVRG